MQSIADYFPTYFIVMMSVLFVWGMYALVKRAKRPKKYKKAKSKSAFMSSSVRQALDPGGQTK